MIQYLNDIYNSTTVFYNIDISLMIQYLDDIYNSTAFLPRT